MGGSRSRGGRARTLRFLAPRLRRDSNAPGGPDCCAPASGGSPVLHGRFPGSLPEPGARRLCRGISFPGGLRRLSRPPRPSCPGAPAGGRCPSPTRADTRSDGGSDTGRSSGDSGSSGGGGGGFRPGGSPDRTDLVAPPDPLGHLLAGGFEGDLPVQGLPRTVAVGHQEHRVPAPSPGTGGARARTTEAPARRCKQPGRAREAARTGIPAAGSVRCLPPQAKASPSPGSGETQRFIPVSSPGPRTKTLR